MKEIILIVYSILEKMERLQLLVACVVLLFVAVEADPHVINNMTDFWDFFKKVRSGTSIVVQWLGISQPTQVTQVQFLVQELRSQIPQGSLALCHNCQSSCALEPVLQNQENATVRSTAARE